MQTFKVATFNKMVFENKMAGHRGIRLLEEGLLKSEAALQSFESPRIQELLLSTKSALGREFNGPVAQCLVGITLCKIAEDYKDLGSFFARQRAPHLAREFFLGVVDVTEFLPHSKEERLSARMSAFALSVSMKDRQMISVLRSEIRDMLANNGKADSAIQHINLAIDACGYAAIHDLSEARTVISALYDYALRIG